MKLILIKMSSFILYNIKKVLLIGPKTTPYEKGLFIMFVNFPDNYPGF